MRAPPPDVHDSSTTRHFVSTSADVLFHGRRGAPRGPVGPLEPLPELRVQIHKVGRALVGAGRALTAAGRARSPASRMSAAAPAECAAEGAHAVIFNGTALIPPATAVNYVPWAMVGFMYVPRPRPAPACARAERAGGQFPVRGPEAPLQLGDKVQLCVAPLICVFRRGSLTAGARGGVVRWQTCCRRRWTAGLRSGSSSCSSGTHAPRQRRRTTDA